jgi:hypothetical protein
MNLTQQRFPAIQGLNRLTDNRLSGFHQALQKSHPASVDEVDPTGTIVTVKFETVSQWTLPKIKMPVYGPEFCRWPLKKGTKGLVLSADYYMGEMSGLGKGKASYAPPGNLSTGVFFPCGNVNFTPTDDPEKTLIYGPNGVILRDENSQIIFNLDTKTGLTVTWKGQVLMRVDDSGFHLNFQGMGLDITSAGTLIDNITHVFPAHTHQNVQPGSGTSGPVVP